MISAAWDTSHGEVWCVPCIHNRENKILGIRVFDTVTTLAGINGHVVWGRWLNSAQLRKKSQIQ